MLRSMTGHGQAQRQSGQTLVQVDVRSVNHRFLKVLVRTPEGLSSLEPLVEQQVRAAIHRGTVSVDIQVQRPPSAEEYQINRAVLVSYRQQLQKLCTEMQWDEGVALADLLMLPGVVCPVASSAPLVQELWPLVQQTLQEALDQLNQMRRREGEAMAEDLIKQCGWIEEGVERIARRAP